MCLAQCLMSMHSCAVHVTIFSTHGKFQPVSNFTELHALTLAAVEAANGSLNPCVYHCLRPFNLLNWCALVFLPLLCLHWVYSHTHTHTHSHTHSPRLHHKGLLQCMLHTKPTVWQTEGPLSPPDLNWSGPPHRNNENRVTAPPRSVSRSNRSFGANSRWPWPSFDRSKCRQGNQVTGFSPSYQAVGLLESAVQICFPAPVLWEFSVCYNPFCPLSAMPSIRWVKNC